MDIDKKEVEWIRDKWFESVNGMLTSDDPVHDELHRRMVSLTATLEELPESRRQQVDFFIFSTLSNAQFESAVEYMIRHTPPEELLMIYDRIKEANERGMVYSIDYPGILQIARNRLRDGGFDWNFRYLENCTNSVYITAAIRLARELGVPGPNIP